MKTFLISLFFLFCVTSAAYADWATDVVVFDCSKDRFKVTVLWVHSDDVYPANEIKPVEKKKTERGDAYIHEGSIERKCLLSDGNYRFVFNGSPQNGNPLGQCGMSSPNVRLMLYKDGNEIYNGPVRAGPCFTEEIQREITKVSGGELKIRDIPQKELILTSPHFQKKCAASPDACSYLDDL